MPSIDVTSSVVRGSAPTRLVGAGTAVRFGLLLLFIAVGSMSLLPTAIAAHNKGPRWISLCALASGVNPDDARWPTNVGATARTFFGSCVAAHGIGAPITWTVVDTVFVFALAAAIYLWLPTWRRRRGRLRPIELRDHGGLPAELRDCVVQAGLRRTPAFLLDPAGRTSDAVVFGRLGRYAVRLNAGLVVRGSPDDEPALLRAVVLHELAHIRNGDVDITYATVALWRAFLVGAVVPYVVLVTYPTLGTTALSSLQSLLRPAILTALVYLMRGDILRTRETHADVDAVGRSADQNAWRGEVSPATVPRFRAGQWFLGLWRIHPSWTERSRSVADPAALFAVTALPMFLTGVTAMLVPIAAELVAMGFGYPPGASPNLPVVWLTTAALATAVVGVALWRGVAYALTTGGPTPSGVRAGCWFGLGMAVGELLSFRTAGEGQLPAHPEVLVVLVVGATVLTWWVAECADLWLRTCRGRSIRVVQLVGLAAAFVVFSVWFGYWVTEAYVLLIGLPAGFQSISPGLPVWILIIFGLITKPWIFVGATTLWLFPLASWLRRPAVTTPPWVRQFHAGGVPTVGGTPYGDIRPGSSDHGWSPYAQSAPLAHAAPPYEARQWPAPSPRFPTFGIVLGGALCCVAVALVMLSLHPAQPAPDGRDASWALHYSNRLIVALILAITATATVVVLTRRRHRLAFALVSCGCAALVGLAGVFFLASIDGCIGPIQVMASTCAWRPVAAWSTVTPLVPFVLDIAIYAAAVAALVATGVAGLVRWLTPGAGARVRGRAATSHFEPVPAGREAQPQSPSRGIVSARRAAVLAASVVVVVFFVNEGNAVYWNPTITAAASSVPDQAQLPQPAAVVRTQVSAWWLVGGRVLVSAVARDFQREGAAARDQAAAAARAGQTSVEIDRSAFRPICADIATDARKAVAFGPIPDRRAQSAWAAARTEAVHASSDCLHALQGEVDGRLFTRSLSEGSKAVNALRVLRDRLDVL
jgi:Zn-dependent protease with chaperone function